MKILYQNTLEGLTFGLTNFDGIETDIRRTRDNKLVIFHDPALADGRIIAQMDLEEIKAEGIPSLADFFNHKPAMDLVNSGKQVWIEPKADCIGSKAVAKEISGLLYNSFMEVVDGETLLKKQENINLLGFYRDLLDPFAKEGVFRVYPISPAISECSPRTVYMRGLTSIFLRSLHSHMKEALKKNYSGVMFASEYLLSPLKFRQPSYEKLLKLMEEYDLELGTNFSTLELEEQYSKIHRFTDTMDPYPRYAKKGEGLYIAHRGTGVHNISIEE